MSILVALTSTFLAVAAVPSPARAGVELEDCTKLAAQGPIVEYECVDRNNERREARMMAVFSTAIDAVEKRQATASVQDERRSHVYLKWSQAAWKEFAEQNCTVVAGLSGGSNAWVTRYWLDCYSEELDRRIKFLEQVAAGEIGGS